MSKWISKIIYLVRNLTFWNTILTARIIIIGHWTAIFCVKFDELIWEFSLHSLKRNWAGTSTLWNINLTVITTNLYAWVVPYLPLFFQPLSTNSSNHDCEVHSFRYKRMFQHLSERSIFSESVRFILFYVHFCKCIVFFMSYKPATVSIETNEFSTIL